MPYVSEKIRITGTSLDRRVKLTQEQREELRHLREFEGWPYNMLAKKYNVSKNLAIFVCNPEVEARNRENFKKLRSDGRYYNKEKNTEAIRKTRNYKQQLYKEGVLKKDNRNC